MAKKNNSHNFALQFQTNKDMKKLFFLLITLTSLISCNKDFDRLYTSGDSVIESYSLFMGQVGTYKSKLPWFRIMSF